MPRHVTRLLKAIQEFGLGRACLAYYYFLLHRLITSQKRAVRSIRVRHLAKPLWIRPGSSDWVALEQIFIDHEYDPDSKHHDDAMDRLSDRIVAKGKRPLIIDWGASAGLSSIWFTMRFPAALVLAVEPEPANFKVLTLNARNFTNILPINAAFGGQTVRVAPLADDDTSGTEPARNTSTCGPTTLSVAHLVRQHADCVLMVVNVDVEGFEVDLFTGGAEWVDDLPLMVFRMRDWMTTWVGAEHSFFSILSRLKRDYLVHGETVFAYSQSALQTDIGLLRRPA